jgi:predicted transcriptional regulator
MVKHRSKYEIVADILSVVRNESFKTKIMYQANLSYALLERYLSDLIIKGLINKKKKLYILTLKGQEYLDKFDDYIATNEELARHESDIEAIKIHLDSFISNDSSYQTN